MGDRNSLQHISHEIRYVGLNLGIPHLKIYPARRSGASIDRFTKSGSPAEV